LKTLLLPPDHLIDNAGVALDELDDLGTDVFIGVGRDWDSVIVIADHLDSYVNSLEKVVFIDAGEDEASLVKGFRTFGGCADADSREWVTYAGEEGAFLRKGAGV